MPVVSFCAMCDRWLLSANEINEITMLVTGDDNKLLWTNKAKPIDAKIFGILGRSVTQ